MIGVVASEQRHHVVREFFELFKTPWQFYQEGLSCDVVLCADATAPRTTAPLVIIYHGDGVNSEARNSDQTIVRVGFDLFAEVERLLTRGQPSTHAHLPTLDLHIESLRDLLLRHDVPVVEIPPLPAEHDFIACLTHDVDHPRMRDHFCDHAMFGFLYRALLGSWFDLFRGRKTLRQVARNYVAALSLPFVYLDLARDFWNQFEEYRAIEGTSPSTFFVIPRKGDPGLDAASRKGRKRAARYDVSALSEILRSLVSTGCEIAVHGIDAWRDAAKGRAEAKRIKEITGAEEVGVRMHWLYFGPESARLLEQAGYSYDSTSGYNDAIGYRAGTTQVFKPLGADRLLELPMHIMDTAMFYPDYMNLSPRAARTKVDALIENASRFGGTLTVNWHDRSIAPERQWVAPYIDLVEKLKQHGAWMPTASEAVAWFRARRSARIEIVDGTVNVALEMSDPRLPGFRLRAHRPAPRHKAGLEKTEFTDFVFVHSAQFQLESTGPKVSAA